MLKRSKVYIEFQNVQGPEELHEKKLEFQDSKGNQYLNA